MTSWKLDKIVQNILGDVRESRRGPSEATLYDGPDLEEIKNRVVSELLQSEGIPEDRLHLCKLPVSPGRYVLLASWHGPHKMKTEKKQMLLNSLLSVLHQLRERLGCEAFFIGGDFNLRYSLAEEVTGGEQMIGKRVIDDREAVDYMIGWSSSNITAKVKVEKGEESDDFNHPVLYITIEIDLDDDTGTCRESTQNRRRDDDLGPGGGYWGVLQEASSHASSGKGGKSAQVQWPGGRQNTMGGANVEDNSNLVMMVAWDVERERGSDEVADRLADLNLHRELGALAAAGGFTAGGDIGPAVTAWGAEKTKPKVFYHDEL